MASLVADYGDSSPESSDESDSNETDNGLDDSLNVSEFKESKLPPPTFSEVKNSVFVNPYLEAENAQIAVLEKHIKMVPQTKIKAKKICWMFKKGKCRYGEKCRFTHTGVTVTSQNKKTEDVDGDTEQMDENFIVADTTEDETAKKRKLKAGLPRGLIPSKKVLKFYKKMKKEEDL